MVKFANQNLIVYIKIIVISFTLSGCTLKAEELRKFLRGEYDVVDNVNVPSKIHDTCQYSKAEYKDILLRQFNLVNMRYDALYDSYILAMNSYTNTDAMGDSLLMQSRQPAINQSQRLSNSFNAGFGAGLKSSKNNVYNILINNLIVWKYNQILNIENQLYLCNEKWLNQVK